MNINFLVYCEIGEKVKKNYTIKIFLMGDNEFLFVIDLHECGVI